MKIRKVGFLVKDIIIFILLIFTIIPLVKADITVINEQGEQSAIINIQPYQINNINYADIFIQGINNYIGDEIFIKRVYYPLQLVTGDIGLGRYSETLLEPFICIEGDLECELEKQNRDNITVYSETDLFAFPDLEFDYATLKLKKHDNISTIVSCSDFDVNTFKCNSKFEVEDVNFISDNSFIYFNLTHFSGWAGTSYFYADMERPGRNICGTNGDGYIGVCDSTNIVETNYTDNVYMDNEAMRVYHETGNRAYARKSFSTGVVRDHYSRIYMYISKEDLSGLERDAPLFTAVDSHGNTVSCGFRFEEQSDEEITCIYDSSSAQYNPTEFGTKINMTEYGLWDTWFTLEYRIESSGLGSEDICECWVNGTQIASINTLDYDGNYPAVYTVVGYPLSAEGGSFNLTFDEHRVADRYIGGYPDIVSSYVKYNIISPLIDQTIYANITDNEGVDDINYVYLEFNYTFNISMYRLDNSNTWEVNISYSNFTAGNNYTYTIYANDSNGQNAIPYSNSFLTNYNDIIFNSSFESGNLYNVTYINGTSNGERFYEAYINYSIVGGTQFEHYQWWFYFKVSNTANKNLHINLTNILNKDFTENRWQNLRPRYSYDNNTNTIHSNWSLVPYDTVSYYNTTTSSWFYFNLTITQDHAWFASTPVYTVSMLNEFIEEIKDSPFINYTNLTVSPHGINVTIIDVTNFTVNNPNKHRIYIIAQQHANEEPQGSWASMGAIRFLINETNETAEAIRNSSIFRFMPILNVDGVYEGRGRFTPVYSQIQCDFVNRQCDPNRQWDNARLNQNPYSIVNVTFYDVRRFNSDIFLDWHGSLNGEGEIDPYHNYYLDDGNPDTTFINFIDNITAVWRYVDDEPLYHAGPETSPPNVYQRWDIHPSAIFEWTLNNYTAIIVANSTIWLEDGQNMMLGINNYFEGLS